MRHDLSCRQASRHRLRFVLPLARRRNRLGRRKIPVLPDPQKPLDDWLKEGWRKRTPHHLLAAPHLRDSGSARGHLERRARSSPRPPPEGHRGGARRERTLAVARGGGRQASRHAHLTRRVFADGGKMALVTSEAKPPLSEPAPAMRTHQPVRFSNGYWRRRRDSNSRYLAVRRFSKPLP